jgi:hypothetical protein
MRSLTNEEEELIERRRADFEKVLHERMPVLTEFMKLLNLPNPPMVLVNADHYLASLDQWMKDQDISSNDRVWIHTRIGYYIGEYFVQRLSGHWFVNDVIDSRFFAMYVVGEFHNIQNPNAMIDPFRIANDFLSEPKGRSLSGLLSTVEKELYQS